MIDNIQLLLKTVASVNIEKELLVEDPDNVDEIILENLISTKGSIDENS